MDVDKIEALRVSYVESKMHSIIKDKPCAASQIANRSVICVCTAQYCDTVIRETPRDGVYFTYTSSERGLRFKKSHGMLQESCEGKGNYDVTLLLNASRTYQIIYGFGGAVTDAAGINYKNLRDPKLMQNFVESYCGSTGLQYSMLRVPIGGTDFSTRPYTYNDVPENDLTLTNFSLAYEDYEYKLPLLKACMKASDVSINVVASMWSPPIWMKTNNKISGLSRLKPEYFQTLADYHYKFLQSYKEEGIRIWGMTLTNEPVNVLWGENFLLNNLGWSLDYLSIWLENYLGPMIRNSTFKDIKIMTGDDQRYAIPLWWNTLISFFPGTYKYLDGVAVHFYSDKIVPASIMTSAMADSPEKFLLYTEACVIPSPSEQPVELGLWSRAEDYITNIMETLNYNSTGWIDWNMCLNPEGGPNWIDNTVDSPVIVFAEAGAFIKQPMFYAMGHFSKFIPQGSRRIHVDMSSEDVLNVAFLTPENSIVVVLYNEGEEKSVLIQLGDKQLVIEMGKKYITTVEFPYRMTSASLKRPLQAFHPKIIRIPN